MLWTLRPVKAEDVSFLYNSFLKSYRDAPAVAGMPNTLFYKKLHGVAESIFRDPNSFTIIACDPAEPDVVFGYLFGEKIGEDLVIHWAYSKHAFRGFGLGKAMEEEFLKIPHRAVYYSMRTRVTDSLMKTRDYTFDPTYMWSHVK